MRVTVRSIGTTLAHFAHRASLILVAAGCVCAATTAFAQAHDGFQKSGADPEASLHDVRMIHMAAADHVAGASVANELLDGRRADIAMLTMLASYTMPESPLASSAEVVPHEAPSRSGWRLPDPDGWTAVVATLALGLFFFVRRLA